MSVRTARYVTRYGDEADPDQERAQAIDTLREGFRAEGFMLDEGSVSRGPVVTVLIDPDGATYRPVDPDAANGMYVDWTATGTPRITDAEVPVVIVDADGFAVVPEPVASEGGDIRVRHGYGGDVTVTAFKPDDEKIGYLFATDLDPDTVHVELVGGTSRLHILRDEGDL